MLRPLQSEPDHYATLGLDRGCDAAQIRAAYRLLAKRHHPDVNPNSSEAAARTCGLNSAYEVLIDPARRRAYDSELKIEPSAANPTRVAKIERNISHDVRLRMEDFFRGASLEVRINDPANPAGAETYQLLVPPETAPGARFRLPRTALEGGFVKIRVRAMPGFRFKIRGSDLCCDLRINSRRAASGGMEMMQGPTGAPLCINIPASVARGEILRINGEGMPKPRGGRGDLLVRLKVSIPTDLSHEQRDLFKRLAETFDAKVTPQENKGFFDKVKDLLG